MLTHRLEVQLFLCPRLVPKLDPLSMFHNLEPLASNELLYHKVLDIIPLSAPESRFVDHSMSIGLEKRAHIEALAALPRIAEAWRQRHGKPMQPADVDAMYSDFVPLLLAVLEQYSGLIPGVNDAMGELKAMGIRIAASTGYFVEAMEVVGKAAARQGYRPEFTISANQVPAGRPAPWMIYRAMEALGVYPPPPRLAVGDTVPDVEAALNAGVWAVGVAQTGNEIGLSETEFVTLPLAEQEARRSKARATLAAAGAHYMIDGVWELPAVVREINARLAKGEKP